MGYYLYMDGIDDYIKTPSITFNEVLLDVSIENREGVQAYYFDARNGFSNSYFTRETSGLDNFGPYTVYKNDIEVQRYQTFVVDNERTLFRLVFNSTSTDDVNVFSRNNNASPAKGIIYEVKFLNNGTLVAHYDMNTGTVNDQSGNGNHATNNGGIFVNDGTGGGTTDPPSVTIVNINAPTADNTLSDEPNMDRATVKFTFDQDVTEWRIRTIGTDHDTGILADSGGAVSAGTEITAEVDYTELYGEGQNRVNIYGKNADGQWTPYT